MFPGENELDQLFLIQKSLGSLPPDLHERFVKNPRFLGMKFPGTILNSPDNWLRIFEMNYFVHIVIGVANSAKQVLKLRMVS